MLTTEDSKGGMIQVWPIRVPHPGAVVGSEAGPRSLWPESFLLDGLWNLHHHSLSLVFEP